jgi:hypothetical protein
VAPQQRDDQPDFAMATILLDIHADVKVIKSKIVDLTEDRRDHEDRIRRLERFRNAWPSLAGIAAAAAVAAVAVTFLHP